MRVQNDYNKYMAEYVRCRYINLKIKALDLKGNKCQRCGYDECLAALSFHHRDPTQKEMSWGHLRKRNWEFIKKELEKCDLLCLNCHAKEHYKPEVTQEALELLRSKVRNNLEYEHEKCILCGNQIKRTKWGKRTKYCSSKCVSKAAEKIKWPDILELQVMVKKFGRIQVGKSLGVSESAVRKRIRNHALVG